MALTRTCETLGRPGALASKSFLFDAACAHHHFGQIHFFLSIMVNVSSILAEPMPSKSPVIFPQEQRLLAALGERVRLARLRRKLTTTTVAQRAGISRTSLYNVEAGDPGATLGTYLRVLAVLGLEKDIDTVAADDQVGRKLQDLQMDSPPKSGHTAAAIKRESAK
jgi:transcriptional regulator with XRE-family HTH domain